MTDLEKFMVRHDAPVDIRRRLVALNPRDDDDEERGYYVKFDNVCNYWWEVSRRKTRPISEMG